MPTSSGSSSFNRLVQNPRQTVTRGTSRRLAEPTIITTIPVEPYIGHNHSPVDVFSPSNVLGMFDNNNVPINPTYRSPQSSSHAQNYPYYDFNTHLGPGRFYTYLQPENQINDHTISAWTKDFTGQDVYVGHGKLEEVGSDAESANLDSASRSRFGRLLTLNAGGHESNELLNEELAYLTTPPPCPRPRKLPSLRPTPTGSDFMSFKATSVPAVTTTNDSSLAHILDEPTEVHLVTNNLAMVESSLEDVQFINTFFLAKSDEHDLSKHIDLCVHIEESLKSLRGTLTLRTQIGAEEWSVRSQSWDQKYGNRLLSLNRTLQRLARLRQLIETHSLRSHQRTAIRTKLEQHEAKLADLASKYSAAFDRLRLRHLHFLLKQSHDQSHNDARERRKSRLASRRSFERRWAEGKKLRAGLRVIFHDQRDCLYNNNKSQPRLGRQSSAQ